MGDNDNQIPWMMEEDGWGGSTEAPGLQPQTGDSIVVLAAVVVGVLLAISLLFSLALLIDCRNRRAVSVSQNSPKRRRRLLLGKLPHFIRNSPANNDGISFANKMCHENTAPVLPDQEIC